MSAIRSEQDEPDNELKSFFLQDKPVNMIAILRRKGESYASELSSTADTTYSHAVKVMNRMQDHDLVTSTQNGRKKEYELTDKGRDVADHLVDLMDSVDGMVVPGSGEDEGKWGLDKIK